MKAIEDVRPVEQPTPIIKPAGEFVAFRPRMNPSPDEPLDTIMEKLEDTEMLEQFLTEKNNITFEAVGFPVGFLHTYRRPPETFLERKKGPCSNYANAVGEWAALHGKKSYTISICPQNPVTALSSPWHQFQIFCIQRNRRYLVMDNGKRTYCTGLSDYVNRYYPGMTVLPTGGCVPWRRTSDTVLGALSIHAHANVDEGDMIECTDLDATLVDGLIASARP